MAIPRDDYVAAVERHERRAWAKWTDPYDRFKLHKKLQELRKVFGLPADGGQMQPIPPTPEDADPELFDTKDAIAKDEAIIEAYLADIPAEQRRPMARGTNHDELLKYWKSSSQGRSYFAQRKLEFRPILKELRDQYITSSPSQPDGAPALDSGE